MNLYKKMLKYPKLIISKVCGPAIAGGCGIITASTWFLQQIQASLATQKLN